MTSPGGSHQVKIVISADVAQAIRALGQTEQGLGGVGRQADQAQRQTRTFGDVLKGSLAAAGIQAGLSGVVGGLKSVVQGGLDYERSMNTFGAVTQASQTQMGQMAETAKQLGADVKIPGASAQSAAAAMTELAKGGLTADQSMQAARGTMILAAAAQVDGAQAAEIQANALNTFGLKADQAGRVANVLANVANKSSGEITDFAQGLAQAGTVASSFGWTIEDTSTYLGLMANAGIKGSDAGTSLKSALTAMLSPTKQQAAALDELGIVTQDANGKMITAQQLTAQLAAAKGRMSDAEFNAAAATAFGTDAVRTALVAAQAGTGGYQDMATALGNVNGAADVAAANSKGLSGVIDALKNTVDTASLSLFEQLQPSIMQVATAATDLVTPLGSALAPVLGSVANLASGTLAPALSGVTGVLSAVAGPVSSLVSWFSDLPSPIGAGVLALGGVIALRGPLIGTFTTASASLSTLLATLRGTAGAAAAGSAGFAGWIASVRAASGAAATFGVVAKGALSVLGGPIGLALVGATTALSFFSSSTDDAAASQGDFAGALDQTTGKLNDQAAATISSKVASSGLGEQYKALGGNVGDLVDAIGGIPEKQAIVKQVLDDAASAAQSAAGAYTNAGAAVVAGGGEMTLTNDQLSESTDALSGKLASIQGTGNLYTQLLGEMSGAQNTAQVSAEGLGGDLGGAGKAAQDAAAKMSAATDKATPFGDALKEIRDAASEADANAQFLSITLLTMAGNTVPAEQRARANAAAFREVGQATRDIGDANDSVAEKQAKFDQLAAHLGETLDGQAESASNAVVTQQDLDAAGRDLADAQANVQNAADKQKDALDKAAQSARDMTADAYNQAVAQGDMSGAIDAAVAKMVDQREQFIGSATDAGIERDAAEKLADQQGLIPDNVRTTYEQQGLDSAIQRTQDLNAELDRMNNRTIRYYVIEGRTVQLDAPSTTGGGASTTDYLRAQAQQHATGGFITGPGSGTSDDIPAMLSNGEFVVTASATARNRGLLEAMNAGKFARGGIVRFAAGGAVGEEKAGDDAKSEQVSATLTAPDPALFSDSWDQIVKSTKDAWDTGISPVMGAMDKQNSATGDGVTNLDRGVVAPAWANITGNIQSAWNAGILPTYTSLGIGTQQAGVQQGQLRDLWSTAWQQNQAVTSNTTNWLVGGTFPTLNAGAQGVGAEQQNLAAVTDASWTAIGSVIQSTYDGKIVPAWTGVKNFTTEMAGFFTGVRAGMDAATATAIGDIGRIKGAIQDFFNLVNAQVAAAGFASGGVVEGFATGGEITKGTTGRADDVLIRASKGEYVVNAVSTANNRELLDAINYGNAKISAADLPAYANGGVVGNVVKQPTDDYITAGVHKAMEAGVNKALAAFPMGFGGTVIYNGNITVDGITAPLPIGTRGEFIKAVASKMGTSYVWGAAGPDVFDCSGLMSWGLAAAGHGVGRLTAEGFNSGFPHISPEKPGDLVTFDTGRLGPGQAGHIGMVFDPSRKIMLHTDGAGPARASDYASRGGLLGFEDPIGGSVGFAPRNTNGDPPAGGWLGSILAKITQGGAGAAAGGSVNYDPNGGWEQWRPTVLAALAFMGESPSLANTVLNQIRTESSGNPNAINLSDSNAARGTPSKGLVQVIDPTFRSYAMAPYNQNIYDPMSNIIAGANYARHVYGSIAAGMRGVAYDGGGVLPPGFTMAYNGTGQNEFTFTREQMVDTFSTQLERAFRVIGKGGNSYQGGQHGGVHIDTIVNQSGSDITRQLAWAAVDA